MCVLLWIFSIKHDLFKADFLLYCWTAKFSNHTPCTSCLKIVPPSTSSSLPSTQSPPETSVPFFYSQDIYDSSKCPIHPLLPQVPQQETMPEPVMPLLISLTRSSTRPMCNLSLSTWKFQNSLVILKRTNSLLLKRVDDWMGAKTGLNKQLTTPFPWLFEAQLKNG